MIEIRNLFASVDGKEILKGISLSVEDGQVHAIMGRNGSGKSTLANIIAGHSAYTVTKGDIVLNGKDLLAMKPEERARSGVFLGFQYPIEIPGVSTATFLKEALNAKLKAAGKPEMDTVAFLKYAKLRAKSLSIPDEMLKRPVNVGFSGGEKKRLEVLHMAVLEPSFCVLDEMDSGLDIDALKVVADGVNVLKTATTSFLLITHYNRLLDYITPDVVHVMLDGRIVKTGDGGLAKELEAKGYTEYENL